MATKTQSWWLLKHHFTIETHFLWLLKHKFDSYLLQTQFWLLLTRTKWYNHVKKKVIHITPVLAMLHWLPIRSQVSFKLATPVYIIRRFGSPSYLALLFTDYKPVRDLRSSSMLLLRRLNLPRHKTSKRAFCHLAVVVWNFLPLTVRECRTIRTLKKQLKTYLYTTAYKST